MVEDVCPIFVWSEYTCELCDRWFPVTAWIENGKLHMHLPGLTDTSCCALGCQFLSVRMHALIEEEVSG